MWLPYFNNSAIFIFAFRKKGRKYGDICSNFYSWTRSPWYCITIIN